MERMSLEKKLKTQSMWMSEINYWLTWLLKTSIGLMPQICEQMNTVMSQNTYSIPRPRYIFHLNYKTLPKNWASWLITIKLYWGVHISRENSLLAFLSLERHLFFMSKGLNLQICRYVEKACVNFQIGRYVGISF